MDNLTVLFSEDEVKSRIRELADELSGRYKGKEVVMVGVLKGAVFFFTELVQRMSIPVQIDFIQTASYGSGTESSGEVKILKDIDINIEGKYVIIVEDIMDTGITIQKIKEIFAERDPAAIEVVVLLDKPERRKSAVTPDDIGFEVPDEFIVGWGLDYDQKYRDLTYIGIINEQK